MSVRLTSADFDDSLTTTLPSDLTLSGDFSVGYWMKPITTMAGVMAWSIAPTTGSFGFIVMGEFPHRAYLNSNPVGASSFTLTADTWYWVEVQRSGSTVTYRIFDDSTSTTPAFTPLTTTDSTNFTGVDAVVLGDEVAYWNNGCVNAEFELLKIHTGVAWSAAESRTESQNYTIQKSGGTDRYAWRLKDIDADTDGLYEVGGAGPNFTNSGVTNGSTSPTNLSEYALSSSGTDSVKVADSLSYLVRPTPSTCRIVSTL